MASHVEAVALYFMNQYHTSSSLRYQLKNNEIIQCKILLFFHEIFNHFVYSRTIINIS